MKNRKVTLEELNRLNPCQPAEHFLGQDWSGTILDILNHSRVKDADKVWAVTKLFDEKHARLFAVGRARSVLHNIMDLKVRNTIENTINVAEKFANGLVDRAALDAAAAAASDAAAYAATAAAYAAAMTTTDATADYAAAYAAAAAEYAARSDAATASDYAAAYAAAAAAYAARSASDAAAYAATAAAYATMAVAVEELKSMLTPEGRVKFIRTNVKLGNRSLYIKVRRG